MLTMIRITHVKKYRSGGKTYAYFRPTGERFSAEFGTPAFVTEWKARMAGWRTPKPEEKPGTLHQLIAAYRKSPEFTSLAAATQKGYLWHFKILLRGIGGIEIAAIDGPAAIEMRDQLGERGFRVANLTISILRRIWKWGRGRNLTPVENPFAGIEKIARPRGKPKGNRPWSPEEFAAVMNAASPDVRMALALGRYAGLRKADMVRFSRPNYDGTAIRYVTQKSEGSDEPIEVWLPCPRDLRQILDAAQWGQDGRPMKIGADGLDTAFGRLRNTLLEAERVQPGLTLHGLRHSAATELAEAGASDSDIAAVLGQRTLTMARHYSRKANQKRRATRAMRLVDRTGTEPESV